MNSTSCCVLPANSAGMKVEARTATSGSPSPTRVRRCLDAAGWILPGSILALLPKCPACIVAYVAIASGIGISVTTATCLRMALILLCAISLAYFVVTRRRRSWVAQRFTSAAQRALILNPLRQPKSCQ